MLVSKENNQQQRQPCPHCGEEISVAARKCPHCQEFIARWQRRSRTLVTQIGVITACLSVFYALREGYFYIDEQQRLRQQVRSYAQVANEFEQIDSLLYARNALVKALALSPADPNLQRRLFVIQATNLLRDLDNQSHSKPAQNTQLSELILEGYRLQQHPFNAAKSAELKVLLARLLAKDWQWNNDDGVTMLLEQALLQQPSNAEVKFRLGLWLIKAESDKTRGLQMIKTAVQMAAENPIYSAALGDILLEQQDYMAALGYLRRAAALSTEQDKLDKIRAANDAKHKIRKLLLAAHQAQPIYASEFFTMDKSSRQALIEQVLLMRPNDRQINFIAAQFYYHHQDYKKAEEAARLARSDAGMASLRRGYEVEQNRLLRDVLQQRGSDPQLLADIEQALAEYESNMGIEEALEWGLEGRHLYKLGLRVQVVAQGLKIVQVYSGYPFAKAGVRTGDILLLLAHRQAKSINELGYILDRLQPGNLVPMRISRDGEEILLQLTVE